MIRDFRDSKIMQEQMLLSNGEEHSETNIFFRFIVSVLIEEPAYGKGMFCIFLVGLTDAVTPKLTQNFVLLKSFVYTQPYIMPP